MKLSSIVFKITLPLLLITAIVTGTTLIVIQTYIKKTVEDVFIKEHAENIKNIYTLRIENIISNVIRNGMSISSSYEIHKFLESPEFKKKILTSEVASQFKAFKEAFHLDTIDITDRENRYNFNERGFQNVIDTNESGNEWFLKTLEGKQKYKINTDSDEQGKLYIWIDTLIGDVENPVGIVGGRIDVSGMLSLLLKEFEEDDASALIINSENIIQYASCNQENINKNIAYADMIREKKDAFQRALQTRQELVMYTFEDQERYLLFIPVDELNWTVVVDFSKERFLTSLSGVYKRIIIGGSILLFLLFLFVGWGFSLMIAKPLQILAKMVDEYDFMSDFHSPICTKRGYEIGMICNALTNSAKMLRLTIKQYRESEELMRSLINATDDLIFYKDTNSNYLGCNIAYEKWSDRTSDEIIGKRDIDFYPLDIAHERIRIDKLVMQERRTVVTEERFQKSDGNYVVLQVKKSPFYDDSGEIKGVVVIARDMTKFKKMEYELRTLNSSLESHVQQKTKELQVNQNALEKYILELEKANEQLVKVGEEAMQAAQARSNFISSISHELRTPLNAIINFTDQVIEDFDEMLEDKELQADTQIFLSRVMVNSKHLLQLINDLLEFTKAEAGKMDYSIEVQDINNILMSAYSNTYSLLKATDIDFRIKTTSVPPLIAAVDKRRFLQILLNLLSNAIKFTEKGYVELRAFRYPNKIIVEIEDTGKGIPEDKQKTVFDPFIQVDNQDYGTGLGLGLVKSMCDDMGIEINLHSVEGKGSTFQLVLTEMSLSEEAE